MGRAEKLIHRLETVEPRYPCLDRDEVLAALRTLAAERDSAERERDALLRRPPRRSSVASGQGPAWTGVNDMDDANRLMAWLRKTGAAARLERGEGQDAK